MNLEAVEEKCLTYLRQAPNPLVPANTLLEFCRREPALSKLELSELLEFLRPHELVKVVDGPDDDEVIDQKVFSEAGIIMGPRVILNTRIPTREQMSGMLHNQIKDMTSALVEALEMAKKANDVAHVRELEEALKKSEDLRQKMNKLL